MKITLLSLLALCMLGAMVGCGDSAASSKPEMKPATALAPPGEKGASGETAPVSTE